MSNINLLDCLYFDNQYKVFDIKWNPVNNDLAIIDFKGRLRLLECGENIDVKKNYKVSNESLFCMDYSYDGESNSI